MDRLKAISSKLFKTGFFHIFGSNVINRAILFLSSVILIRILSKPDYGVYTYAWNIYSIIILLGGMGIESGVLQLASERNSDDRYVNNIFNYGTRFGLKYNIILFVLILGIGLFAPLKVERGRILLCMLCLFPEVQLLSNMTMNRLRAQKRNREYSNLNIINSVAMLALTAGLAVALREKGLVISGYLSGILTVFLGWNLYHARILSRETPIIGEDRKPLLKISFISMCNNGLSQLMYLLDVFVLGIVDPQETILASYKVATSIPTALTFIPTALITYIYPYFAEHRNDKAWCLEKYKKILLGTGVMNAVISGFLFLAAPLVVRILYGEQYLDAVPVFRILAVNYFFSGTFRMISGNLLVTQRKLKFNFYVALISSSINIVADYFFIQWWGSVGAAMATVLVVLVSSIMSTVYLVAVFRGKTEETSLEEGKS